MKANWEKALTLSFLLSLFFELTQLTGLYCFYATPFRLFDVDDLIRNTAGGMAGYFLSRYFTFFLPSREDIDKRVSCKRKKRLWYELLSRTRNISTIRQNVTADAPQL